MLFLRRTLPLIIAFVMGMIGILVYYSPHSGAQALEQEVTMWNRIVFAFALVLGIYSLMRLHWGRVQRQQAGWAYSFLVFVGFVVMLIFAIYNNGQGPLKPQVIDSGPFVWMFDYVQVPADATMFSILAFFIASAAYRTFRARTPEAAILLVSAIIVMIGRVPIGGLISDSVPAFSQWLMAVPNLAATRGILLGVSLAAIATSLRIIFGIERSYLGGGEE
ncbi:MAG: hypothetical protein J4F29_16870 [Candidatus Latescibacteria bacterium]|nr:hypothetical protein [Candidatus Latescibacterota bacterium]